MTTPVFHDEKNVIPLRKGQSINVNGLRMRVMNFAARSVTLRPEGPMIFVVRGVPMILHKLTSNGDLVLRIAPEDLLNE